MQLLRWFQATSDIAVNEKSSISGYKLDGDIVQIYVRAFLMAEKRL